MTLSQLLQSLSAAERDFIAGLDYGADRTLHRAALDTVIANGGEVDFDTEGVWYPYEVIELGKNWLQEGHEREYAACMVIVLWNIETGRDPFNDLEGILAQQYDSIQALPNDLREIVDLLIERILEKSAPSAAPDDVPATRLGNSGFTKGPPSVS
jgi:hypothetical protein